MPAQLYAIYFTLTRAQLTVGSRGRKGRPPWDINFASEFSN